MFKAVRRDVEDDSVLMDYPPTRIPFVRTPRADTPIADLSRLSKVIALIGPGGSGKTVVARHIAGELLANGKADRAMLAALDQTVRTLAEFFHAVEHPPSSDPAETADWLQGLLQFLAENRGNAVLDFGGNDLSLIRTLERMPGLVDTLEQEGVGVVAAYMLTPRVGDLTTIAKLDSLGFRPKATALILNLARADKPTAFDALRRHPTYRSAMDRGAVELWMPKLNEEVSGRVERAKVLFRQAMNGEAPDGRKPADLTAMERSTVREFHERMRSEFKVIDNWMPWN
jgi:RecA/RadA recombinase